jgi:hypothetical protein
MSSAIEKRRKKEISDIPGKKKTTYGVFPVAKTIDVIAWIAAHHRDKSVHHQS